MVTKEQTFLEYIQEHCTYCPDDMFAVAQALLSVESQLDYSTQYELEYLLQRYVIAVARESDTGLASILEKFPLNDNTDTVEEAAIALYNKAIEHKEIDKDIIAKLDAMTEASDNKFEKKEMPKKKKKEEEPSSNKEKVKEALIVEKLTEIHKPPENLEGQEELITEAKVMRLADSNEDGSVWHVRMIVSGHTQSGRYFSDDVLQEAIHLFEGTRSYVNHPPEDYNGGDRPINTLVGWYDNVTLKEGDGLYADWHILTNSGVPWLKPLLLELAEENKLDLIGLSLLGLGKNSFKKVDGQLVKFSEGISYVRSVDLVDIPGAGGKVIESIKESDDNKVRSELMTLKGMTVEQLKEANPELYEEIMALSASKEDPSKEDPKVEVEKHTEESNQENDVIKRMEIRECNTILADALKESNLPQPMKDAVIKQFKGTIFNETDLDNQISMYREAAAYVAPYGGGGREDNVLRLPSSAQIITSEERVQAAMDRLFGLEISDDLMDTPHLSGIKEAYIAITGDHEFTWGAIPLDERIREGAGSTPTASKVVGGSTVTFSNVLGTSMNRRLVRQYRRQNMWWEPFTTIVSLNDLKQQDRNRLESLGALSERTTAGAEYAELTWAEFQHTYTPTEYGNLVPIAQRAVVDDDLRSLVRVSDELGRSAGITLNEYTDNLFTQNSGDGPVFIDVDQAGNTESASENVFQGSGTAEHNNRITSALNRTSFNDAANRIRLMLDKSTKRIGLEERYLLVPVELREVALQLERSSMVPDSANRAVNIFAGTFTTIVVPNFTDPNNWYLMSSPDQLDMIEMGFLNGRREPEMFVQSDPTAGMNFTHDVVAYKIRHRYGGGWIDYRGSVASIVA